MAIIMEVTSSLLTNEHRIFIKIDYNFCDQSLPEICKRKKNILKAYYATQDCIKSLQPSFKTTENVPSTKRQKKKKKLRER